MMTGLVARDDINSTLQLVDDPLRKLGQIQGHSLSHLLFAVDEHRSASRLDQFGRWGHHRDDFACSTAPHGRLPLSAVARHLMSPPTVSGAARPPRAAELP